MEKKYTGLVVCIAILILIVLGLAGFIVYDKVINNRPNDNVAQPDNNDEQNKDPKELYSFKKLGEKIPIDGKGHYEGATGEISFEYPVININSEEIRNVNNEILKEYQNAYSFINSNYTKEVNETGMCQITIKRNGKIYGGSNFISSLDYNVFENGDYLSIVIENARLAMCDDKGSSYLGYVINKETNKIMSNSEILEMFYANNDEKLFIDAYNENAKSLGLNDRAKSIDDLKLYIYKGKLVLCLAGSTDGLEQLIEYRDLKYGY